MSVEFKQRGLSVLPTVPHGFRQRGPDAAGRRRDEGGCPTDVTFLESSLRHRRIELLLKRQADFWGALAALLVLSPVCLLAALLIRITSPGPVIFRQTRVGFRQRPFVLYKFRTMRMEWDSACAAAQAEAAGRGVLVKAGRDSRVTGAGRILRSTSLDEVPQLFNVLKGDMSLVGPRPLIPFMLAPHPEFSQARSLVRPGITGLWQIRDRANNTSAAAMMPHDLEYVRRFSLGLDLAILLRTPFVVVSRRGAC